MFVDEDKSLCLERPCDFVPQFGVKGECGWLMGLTLSSMQLRLICPAGSHGGLMERKTPKNKEMISLSWLTWQTDEQVQLSLRGRQKLTKESLAWVQIWKSGWYFRKDESKWLGRDRLPKRESRRKLDSYWEIVEHRWKWRSLKEKIRWIISVSSLELISSGPAGTFDLSKGQTYQTPQRKKVSQTN